MDKFIARADQLFSLVFKYELHAFILLLTGVTMLLHGLREEGFAVVGCALTIFKGKFGS